MKANDWWVHSSLTCDHCDHSQCCKQHHPPCHGFVFYILMLIYPWAIYRYLNLSFLLYQLLRASCNNDSLSLLHYLFICLCKYSIHSSLYTLQPVNKARISIAPCIASYAQQLHKHINFMFWWKNVTTKLIPREFLNATSSALCNPAPPGHGFTALRCLSCKIQNNM